MRLVTDITGAVVWSERYRPFGSAEVQSGSIENDYRFTGKAWDAEAGLFYFNARWMDPDTGRFISEDPLWGNILDPQSLNRFAYGRNNPFRYKDPTGRKSMPVANPSVTSGRGYRDSPTHPGQIEYHPGTDYSNAFGASVGAIISGEIYSLKQNQKGKANSITVQSFNKNEAQSMSHVASDLEKGDIVTEGQIVGQTDTSGRADGPHLHLECFEKKKKIDCEEYLEDAEPFTGDDNLGEGENAKEDIEIHAKP